MSNVATSSPAARPGIATIRGRIASRSRRITTANGVLWLTVIKTPAADAYSSPATLEVRSTESLGQAGEEWAGEVRIGGYARTFNAEGHDGETVKVQSANVILDVL